MCSRNYLTLLLTTDTPPCMESPSHRSPRRSRRCRKVGVGRALVKMSAVLSLDRTRVSDISPDCARSRRKWYLMSTCLTRACGRGSSDNAMAESLSQNMSVGLLVESCPMSLNSARSQIHSCALSNAAMYSASHNEAATVRCFLAAHDTAPVPRFQTYPPTLRRVLGQLAQSESVKPVSVVLPLMPLRCSHKLRMPFK